MNVSLTPRLAGFVKREVKSGLYNNASEVMREALRIMKAQRRRAIGSEDTEETARRIASALASVKRGGYADYDEPGLRNLGRRIVSEIDGMQKRR